MGQKEDGVEAQDESRMESEEEEEGVMGWHCSKSEHHRPSIFMPARGWLATQDGTRKPKVSLSWGSQALQAPLP